MSPLCAFRCWFEAKKVALSETQKRPAVDSDEKQGNSTTTPKQPKPAFLNVYDGKGIFQHAN